MPAVVKSTFCNNVSLRGCLHVRLLSVVSLIGRWYIYWDCYWGIADGSGYVLGMVFIPYCRFLWQFHLLCCLQVVLLVSVPFVFVMFALAVLTITLVVMLMIFCYRRYCNVLYTSLLYMTLVFILDIKPPIIFKYLRKMLIPTNQTYVLKPAKDGVNIILK